jgi:predicted site-specific integrase-resolvase
VPNAGPENRFARSVMSQIPAEVRGEIPVAQGVQVSRRTLSVWRNGRLHPARSRRGRLWTRRDQPGRHSVLHGDFHWRLVRDVRVESTCRINDLYT